MTPYRDTQLLIDGHWTDAASGARIEVFNPATGEVAGHVAHTGAADLDRAVAAAARGFETWRNTPAVERAAILRRAASLLRERADLIAPLMTIEQGKPLAEARTEVLRGADTLDWFAEEARRVYGRIIPARGPDILNLVHKEPVGPVAAFTPWNFPINQLAKKLAAALAAGCSIIAKAPEETPASPAELVRTLVDAGTPAGVVGLLFGTPAEISGHLIAHPVIRKISFTGSTAIGRELAVLAGRHMKRITLELGGHAPALVFADADIPRAAKILADAKFRNGGQVCIAPTRMLVEASVRDEFLAHFTAAAESVRVGDGFDPETRMGPLANPRRVKALEDLVADAVAQGAQLVTGGRAVDNTGFFFAPTILCDVPPEARIMSEEPFGPVAIVNRFEGLEDGLAQANRSDYALAAFGFTRSALTMSRLGRDLACGMLTINHVGFGGPELPFGGLKDSGYGVEGGSEGIEAYLHTKLVTQHVH